MASRLPVKLTTEAPVQVATEVCSYRSTTNVTDTRYYKGFKFACWGFSCCWWHSRETRSKRVYWYTALEGVNFELLGCFGLKILRWWYRVLAFGTVRYVCMYVCSTHTSSE